MSDELTPYITTIQRCETAINRIRAAIRAGNDDSPDVGEEFMAIPCLNDGDEWCATVSKWIKEWASK